MVRPRHCAAAERVSQPVREFSVRLPKHSPATLPPGKLSSSSGKSFPASTRPHGQPLAHHVCSCLPTPWLHEKRPSRESYINVWDFFFASYLSPPIVCPCIPSLQPGAWHMVALYNKYLLNKQIHLEWEGTSVVFLNIQIGKRQVFGKNYTKRLTMWVFYFLGGGGGEGEGLS